MIVDLADGARSRPPFFQRTTNVLGDPVWSPDGAFVAVCASCVGAWWLPVDAVDGGQGAAGGPVTAGWVWIHDVERDDVRQYDLVVDLPPGWGADASPNDVVEVGPLRFVDHRTIEVTLPDGSKRARTIG